MYSFLQPASCYGRPATLATTHWVTEYTLFQRGSVTGLMGPMG